MSSHNNMGEWEYLSSFKGFRVHDASVYFVLLSNQGQMVSV